MLRYGDYMVVERKEDLFNDKERIIWDEEDRTRFWNYNVVYHGGDKENYPQYYKYAEPWDEHFCGSWYKCEKTEVKEFFKELLKWKTIEIENIKNAIDKI